MKTTWLLSAVTCLIINTNYAFSSALKNKTKPYPASKSFTFDVTPETFQLNIYCNGIKEQASMPLPALKVFNLVRTASKISWEYPDKHLSVLIEKKPDYLDVSISATEKAKFTWPNVQAPYYTLPLWEGKYIPATDKWWKAFLKKQSLNFLEEFSMGFFAINKPQYGIVYIAKNRFNDVVKFNTDSAISFSFIHDFTSIDPKKTYGFRIYVTDNDPVAISAVYKRYVQKNGWFKTLEQKAANNSNIRKLYGAPHIYFWTHGIITPKNIRWDKFLTLLKTNDKLMNWLTEVLEKYYDKDTGTEFGEIYQECHSQNQLTEYQQEFIVNALNKAITLQELHNPTLFNYPVSTPPQSLTEQQLYVFNKSLLKSALKDAIDNPQEWGKADVELLTEMYQSGIKKAWIGLPDWADGLMNPELVKKANQLGYLIGPYDAYHSIQQDEDKEWRSNWFPDSTLYNNATVTDVTGKKITGFLDRGRQLNPTLVLPAVKQRIGAILANHIPYNSWFVDCDAFGEVFDDYTPGHPTTQEQDFNARLTRLEYIGKNIGMVVGSEGGSDYTSHSLAFAQGLEMPVFTWIDPDFKDKNSPYYLGSYWGGIGKIPDIYIRVASIKPVYHEVCVDPVYNLPLFRLVYNNSVITTPHWQSGSLRFKLEVGTRMLSELLYNTPPLYNLNKEEWDIDKRLIIKQVKTWSALHQKAVKLPMTAFHILSEDRMVQQTTFGNRIIVTVNFSDKAVKAGGQIVQARSAIISDGVQKTNFSVKGIVE